jgi:hypothetical protein
MEQQLCLPAVIPQVHRAGSKKDAASPISPHSRRRVTRVQQDSNCHKPRSIFVTSLSCNLHASTSSLRTAQPAWRCGASCWPPNGCVRAFQRSPRPATPRARSAAVGSLLDTVDFIRVEVHGDTAEAALTQRKHKISKLGSCFALQQSTCCASTGREAVVSGE